MKPGIYDNLPFDKYCEIEAINWSTLKMGQKSAAHMRHALTNKSKASGAQRFGTFIHTGVLETLDIAKFYVVMPAFEKDPENVDAKGNAPKSPRATGYYKAKKAEFERVNADKNIVTQDEYNQLRAIVANISHNERARSYINGAQYELTGVWKDPETGVLCKGRFDIVNDALKLLPDLKTAADIDRFEASIGRYSYHAQLAFYAWGWSILTGDYYRPALVVVESCAPHCVQAAPIRTDALAQGDDLWRKMLNLYAECVRTESWPGPDNPDAWDIPAWAYVDDEDVELTIGGETLSV